MTTLRLPRAYYLKRAVTCYEHVGDLRAAAAVLAGFGTPQASADAARRFLALGDLPAAGEAFLDAEQPQAALDCFRRAHLPERALACLQALGDDAQAGALLLELGRHAEAAPLLARALAQAITSAAQAALRFQLAQALGAQAGDAHYRAGLAQLAHLDARPASADAWAALGAWGAAVGRQDRMQEGYAQALRLLADTRDERRWQAIATRYRAAAEACGNRRLVQLLAAQLAARAAPPETAPPPDPADALLEAGRWEDALRELTPRAERGDDAALRRLAGLVEQPRAPRERRLAAAEALGARDPRLLDPRTGDSVLGGYWRAIDAGPFWYGAYFQFDAQERANVTLRQVTLPYPYRIGRYVVTNTEYARFMEAGGYSERRWWTEHGWQDKGSRTQPLYWDDATHNQPNQPVIGVTWYEAVAYCAWLTTQGRAAGWLAAGEEIRLPTSLEWERAARGIDQRPYPWGDEAPDAERANYADTGIERPTPVGAFPVGAAACGALDMAGNVMEWLATPERDRAQVAPQKDFTTNERVLLSWSAYHNTSEQLFCGARIWNNPSFRYVSVSFRVVLSRALSV